MVIDFTAELAPFLWAILGTLLLSAGAILASVDLSTTQRYVRNHRLAVATGAGAILLAVLLAAGPSISGSLGLGPP